MAVLAFALAAAFAVVASATPSHAVDEKDFNVYFKQIPADTVTVFQGPSRTVKFIFENPSSNTRTQRAGSFRVEFPDEFELTDATGVSLSGWTADVDTSTDTLDLYAKSSGKRLRINRSVSVNVTFDANALGEFDEGDFAYTADQQAGGVTAEGGNIFFLANFPTITVVADANDDPSIDITEPTYPPAEAFQVGDSVTVTATVSDPNGDPLTCDFDWGDGHSTDNVEASGGECEESHNHESASDDDAPFTDTRTIGVTVNDGRGGTDFDSVKVLILDNVVNCSFEDNEECVTDDEPGSVQQSSAVAACPPDTQGGCGKEGWVAISLTNYCTDNDCEVVWDADTTTGFNSADAFHLIVKVPNNKKRSAQPIYIDENGEIQVALTCNSQRPFNCLDKTHPAWQEGGGVFPIRFEAKDPRGGYR